MRRGFVCLAISVAALAACSNSETSAPSVPHPDTTTHSSASTLRQLAAAKGLKVGTAGDVLFFQGDADGNQFRSIAAREFNTFVAGNDFKHERLQPSQGVFNFTRADSLLKFAETSGMAMRGHTLVWHNQNARWLTNGTWTQAQATQLMKDHITTVVTHFKGRIFAWDVVNEGLNDDGTRRNTFYSSNVGDAYIDIAFQTARAADPAALLFYNDYNIEGLGRKSDSLYVMVKSMLARGIPIDGIGFQGHFIVGQLPSKQSMLDNIGRFGALGLKVQFTEVDVRLPQPATSDQVTQQAADYRTIFDTCLSAPACQAVITWGLSDKESWIPGTFPGWGQALLYDNFFNAKSAYYSIYNLLSGK